RGLPAAAVVAVFAVAQEQGRHLRIPAAMVSIGWLARQLPLRADAYASALVSVEQRARRDRRHRRDAGRRRSCRIRAVSRAISWTQTADRGAARGADGVAGDPARADLRR